MLQKSRNSALVLLVILLIFNQPAYAISELDSDGSPYPITVDGKVLFEIYSGVGSLSARERAALITSRIIQTAKNPSIPHESVRLKPVDNGIAIMAGKQILILITENEADEEKSLLSYLAIERLSAIQKAISAYRKDRTTEQIYENGAYA